jgi:ribosomal protein S8
MIHKVYGSSNFPLGDLVSAFKRASLLGSTSASFRYTTQNEAICRFFCERGVLFNFIVAEDRSFITAFLVKVNGYPLLVSIKLLYTPTKKIHLSREELAKRFTFRSNGSTVLVSTSQGLLTALKASNRNLGGIPLISF